MANKYELISKLAEETAKEVVKSGETWKRLQMYLLGIAHAMEIIELLKLD